MRVVAIIQARLNSTRLPGKILMPIMGRPLLSHVAERAKAIPGVDQVVIAMPATDKILRAGDDFNDVMCYQYDGDERDVLARFAACAHTVHADVIMRLTGDNPLIDPEVCGWVLQRFLPTMASYCSNTHPGVMGLDTEVFSIWALDQAAMMATEDYDREHVTSWMRASPSLMKLHQPAYLEHQWENFSVDTAEDLAHVRAIYAHLPPGAFDFSSTVKAALKVRRP